MRAKSVDSAAAMERLPLLMPFSGAAHPRLILRSTDVLDDSLLGPDHH
jgi:hypothetical protein